MKHRHIAVSLAVAASLILTGCAPTPKANPTPTFTPKSYVYAPLTGAKYEAGTNPALDGPSVACKIDNLLDARPQINLNATDIVFDEMVEGGLTRLVAVWHSRMPEQVGPVRSIRPMDPDIISPFGGIVCYSGGQLKFVKMMQDTNVFNASETSEQGNGTFSRDKARIAPHNVIVNANKLHQAHLDLAPPQQMFIFAAKSENATAASKGKPVERVQVMFPQATAEWVPTADGTRWERIQDGQPHLTVEQYGQPEGSVLDWKPITAKNVVVLQVRIDRKYGYVPKTVMVDSGKAWVFTGGKYIEATWSKASQTAPIVLTTADGAIVELARGNTWVELMPKPEEGSIEITEGPKATPSQTPSEN